MPDLPDWERCSDSLNANASDGERGERTRSGSLLIASDGLLARVNGEHAEQKLSFVDRFGPPAIQATERKFQRVYVDLFAGPGRNIDPNTGAEFDGAALRALRLRGSHDPRLSFTSAILVNKRVAEHRALASRITRLQTDTRTELPRVRAVPVLGDANIDGVEHLAALDQRSAYAFVFADPACPNHLPWSTIDAIASRAPRSTDLYVLMPLEMGILRMLPYDPMMIDPNTAALDRYFGTDEWRSIYRARACNAQSKQLRRDLVALYMQRLRRHWAYVRVMREVSRGPGHKLYRMLFCSRHPAGDRISTWEGFAAERERSQLGLFA